MSRPDVPEIDPADLRDPADPARVDRIWRRLRRALPSAVTPRPSLWLRREVAFVAGASAAALVGGLLLGRAIWAPPTPADPLAVAVPRETAAPERVATPTGYLRITGRDGEFVAPLYLQQPGAFPSPPAGLPSSAPASPSLPAAPASPPATPPRRLDGSLAPPLPNSTTESTTGSSEPTATTWRARYAEGDRTGALEILRRAPGGADAAMATAATAQELIDLSDVLRAQGGDRDAAIRALTRAVDRFPSDDKAPIAALMAGRLLADRGDHEQAARHFDRAKSLVVRVPPAPDEE